MDEEEKRVGFMRGKCLFRNSATEVGVDVLGCDALSADNESSFDFEDLG